MRVSLPAGHLPLRVDPSATPAMGFKRLRSCANSQPFFVETLSRWVTRVPPSRPTCLSLRCRLGVQRAHCEQIGINAGLLRDKNQDARSAIAGNDRNFETAWPIFQRFKCRQEARLAESSVVEGIVQDRPPALLLEGGHSVAGLDDDQLAVMVIVVDLPRRDLIKSLEDKPADVGLVDAQGSLRAGHDEHGRDLSCASAVFVRVAACSVSYMVPPGKEKPGHL